MKNISRIIIVSLIIGIGLLQSCTTKNSETMDAKKEETKLANQNDLVFYVKFHLKPEYVNDFKNSLLELAEKMSQEESFVSTFFHQEAEDSNKFTIYERWREPDMNTFIKNQLKGKQYRDYYEGNIEEWSATTRDISVLKPLEHWNNQSIMLSANDLVFYVNFHIKPEKIDEWKEAALHVLNSMSVEKTFVGAFLHQDAEDATKFTLYERWAEPDMDTFISNQLNAKDYRKVYEDKLPGMVQSPRTFKVLNPVNSWIKE